MATKMIVFAVLLGHSVFVYPSEYSGYDHNDHAPAPYHFEYAVKDVHTHDIKSQHEVSDGHGNVKGSYSLVEPDGSTRVVEYTADHEHGFNAIVKKIDSPHHHEYVHHDQPTYSYKPSANYKFY